MSLPEQVSISVAATGRRGRTVGGGTCRSGCHSRRRWLQGQPVARMSHGQGRPVFCQHVHPCQNVGPAGHRKHTGARQTPRTIPTASPTRTARPGGAQILLKCPFCFPAPSCHRDSAPTSLLFGVTPTIQIPRHVKSTNTNDTAAACLLACRGGTVLIVGGCGGPPRRRCSVTVMGGGGSKGN